MTESREAKNSIRPDWMRDNIIYSGGSDYEVVAPSGSFLTRKGLPKGNYVLRLNLDTGSAMTLATIAVEPVGQNKDKTSSLQVLVESSNTSVSLPVVLKQRSRIRLNPGMDKGRLRAVISVLPISPKNCLRLLQQWLPANQEPETSNSIQRLPTNQQIHWRSQELFKNRPVRHQSWSKKEFRDNLSKQLKPSKTSDYATYLNKVEPALRASKRDVENWLKLNPDAPKISVVVPTYNCRAEHLEACINSVITQHFPNWELCICDDQSTQSHVRRILENYKSNESRIKIKIRKDNGHICKASNDALSMATGDFVALLDHDDLLTADALYWVARTIQSHPFANLIYSDEDKIDEQGYRKEPHFKPSFNIDLLLSYNFISHLGVYRKGLLDQISGFRPGFEGSQDHDLALRVALESSPDQIVHIPRVLYHWRIHPESTASNPNSKDYTTERGLKAIQHYLDVQHQRGGAKATVCRQAANRFHCTWQLPKNEPSVDLIIPTRDKADILELAVRSILEKTNYSNYIVTIVDNGSREEKTIELFKSLKNSRPNQVRVISYDHEFNYSAINNYAVKQSTADIIGLINNDVEVISDEWLKEMVSHACRPDIGCVGAKLFYSNDTIQHGGVVIGIGGVAGHSHKYFPKQSPGYVDRLQVTQQMAAVTAACLVVRRSIFNEVGGLNEQDLRVAFNDIDFCLRVHSHGYRNIFTPDAQLYHHESISRGSEDTKDKQERFKKEVRFMVNQYGDCSKNKLPVDPFYSPSLSQIHENFSINTDPTSVLEGIKSRSRNTSLISYFEANHNNQRKS